MSKMTELARLHKAMVNDRRYGYSQWPERWGNDGTVINLAGYDVKTGSFDCSSSSIYAAAIVGLPTGTANYTGDMRPQFVANGWLCFPYDASILQVGDIILNEGRHVAIYQGNGYMSEFRHNENGGIYNGIVGDQTGDEACVAPLRNFGQQWILRYPEQKELLLIDGAVHRLYNPYTGTHHFTTDVKEVNKILKLGWNYEGVGWVAPTTGTPVYRLCNPYTGEHLWTTNLGERDKLVKEGWKNESEAFKSNGDKPVYRLFNVANNQHMWTTDKAERNNLINLGWRDEGTAFSAI